MSNSGEKLISQASGDRSDRKREEPKASKGKGLDNEDEGGLDNENEDGEKKGDSEYWVPEHHPKTDKAHSAIFLFIACGFIVAAVLPPLHSDTFATLVLLWPGINFLLLSAAYWFDGDWGTKLLGKDINTGKLAFLPALFFAPFLVMMFACWRVMHCFLREPVCGEVWDGLFVGRYPWEINVDDSLFNKNPITHVVDLTGEFPARTKFHSAKGVCYLCCPSLDRLLAKPQILARVAQVILRDAKCTYVHCANGHGRSAVFAGMLLVAQGHCVDLDEAKRVMRLKREVINWQPRQQRVAEESLRLLRRWGTSD